MTSAIVEKIVKNGVETQVPPNQSIPLSDENTLLFLNKGSVNLFAIEKKEGHPEGLRTLITTLEAPTPLFPFTLPPDAPYAILAITEQSSSLFTIPLREIDSEIQSDPTFLTPWINQIASVYKKEIFSESPIYIAPLQEVELPPHTPLAAVRSSVREEKNKIDWLQIEEEGINFLNYPSLTLPKGPFPLTYTAWIQSLKAMKIRAKAAPDNWKAGLASLHHAIYSYLSLQRESDAAEAKILAEKRFEKEESEIRHSLEEMASILNPLDLTTTAQSTDPLLEAFRLVSASLKIPFTPPQEIPPQKNIFEHVKAIAEATFIRYRRVRLSGTWWKTLSGPMIGFYGEGLEPVALLEKSGHYEMVDPKNQTRTRVTAQIAADLNPSGFSLYPTFPNELHQGKEVLRFYLKHHGREFIPLVFYSLIAALIALFPPFAIKLLFNNVIPNANTSLLIPITVSLFLAAASSSLFFFFRSLSSARIEGQASQLLQTALWDRLLKLPTHFFRRYASGSLILHVISSDRIRALLSGNASRVLFSGLFSLFYLIAMVAYAPLLTLISMGILLLSVIFSISCLIFYVKMRKEFYQWETKIHSFVTQILSSIGKLRIAGGEKNAFSHWAKDFAHYQKIAFRSQYVQCVISTINYVLPFGLYFAIFLYMIKENPDLSIGSFLAFNTAFVSLYIAVIDLSNTLFRMAPIAPQWERTKLIIQEPLEELNQTQDPGVLLGEIQVDEVFFKYAPEDPYILSNINLKANPKECIGIVGPSGCGKSTLLRLLLGFEKATSGAIYYDNKNSDSFSTHGFRKQLGVVLQDEGIIAGSIYENLTCGGLYSQEQILNALENSGLSEDIAALPMGLHTYLAVGGSTLSGGQKQRLLIARALLPQPKILLLDEATSALDNRNQEKVLACIDRLDVTRIIIAHRLTTIKNADRIYVMERGRFVQVGTYDELASQPGLFALMLARQRL